MNQLQPPLWRQLHQVSAVLQAVLSGRSGTAVLSEVPAALRPGVQALSFAVLRNLGRAQALRRHLAPRQPPAAVDALLCVALALSWRKSTSQYDEFTLVDQAVEAAKRTPSTRRQAAFINACLRRFLRERASLLALTDADPVARWNHPAWWIDRLRVDWPNQWQAILTTAMASAPMTLRVNIRKSTRADYLKRLQLAAIQAEPTGASGVILHDPLPVSDIPGFEDGVVSVQDGAAQIAAPLLLSGWSRTEGLKLLDACAAPGGKAAHLLELADVRLTAIDVESDRCQKIDQTLQRLGLHAQVKVADVGDVASWWSGEMFDAILLDAPCSASGIVRRHPDIAWLRRSTDIDQLAAKQRALLTQLWPLVKPGGRLLYCTCSVFRAEGQQPVSDFLATHMDARLMPSPGHLLPADNAESPMSKDNPVHDPDGFFYALLEKTAA